jgi:hypothetical protein
VKRVQALPPLAFFVAAGVVLLLALVIGVAVLFTGGHRDSGSSGPPGADEGPIPSTYSQAKSTSAFDKIAARTADPKPFRAKEVFSPKTIEDADSKATLKLSRSRLDNRCSAAIWGRDLALTLQRGRCIQAARAVYTDKNFAAMVTIFNLADVRAADAVVGAVDPHTGNGFPLVPQGGPRFGQMFSTARGVAMGHYAVITWIQHQDGSGDVQDADLLSLLVATGRPKAVLIRAIGGKDTG